MIEPVVVYHLKRAPIVPDHERWLLLFAGGRIKGQGLSLRGIELMTLYVAPPDLVILGRSSRELWRKPIAGMNAEKSGVDCVKFTAADGEKVSFLAGAYRGETISAFLKIQELMFEQ